jgi:hypothetical protein
MEFRVGLDMTRLLAFDLVSTYLEQSRHNRDIDGCQDGNFGGRKQRGAGRTHDFDGEAPIKELS